MNENRSVAVYGNGTKSLIALPLMVSLSGDYFRQEIKLPKHPRTFHSQGYVSCCVCGTSAGTMYKHGNDQYICRGCKLKEETQDVQS